MTLATSTVSDDEADIRLDRWFRRHFPGLPQSAIQKLCRTGQVRVNGKRAKPDTRLADGDMLRIPPVRVAERPEGRGPASGMVAEVAEAIVWLLGDGASYTSGAVLDVTGGR